MAWKKPDLNAPIVTFTPPPDDATPSSSFRYKPNIMTKKYLESYNVRQNLQNNIGRPIFADGDDGFESLNGYNSNGSDGENRAKEIYRTKSTLESVDKEKTITEPTSLHINDKETNETDTIKITDEFLNETKKEDDEKSIEPDSDGGILRNSGSISKRIGVRFRNSWAKETIQPESSEDDFTDIKKKEKVSGNYI